MKCSKCEGEMEEGFLASMNYYSKKDASTGFIKWGKWGKNIKYFLSVFSGEVKLEGSEHVKSFKCINCGYIENYASKLDFKTNSVESDK